MADITQMIADLREMVASSINPDNGLKSITGAATNLAFNAVIDAIDEAAKTGGGGGGAEIVYATVSQESYPLTQEQITANIAVWQKAKNAYEQGRTIPQIVLDLSSSYSSLMGGNTAYVINPIQLICSENEVGFGLGAFAIDYMGKSLVFELGEDGIAFYQS
mgnify:CR=1 FL=1